MRTHETDCPCADCDEQESAPVRVARRDSRKLPTSAVPSVFSAVDFRGTLIESGDILVYCGRQELKAHLNEGTVLEVRYDAMGAPVLVVQPTRSSSPLGISQGRRVTLRVLRKVAVVRKGAPS